MWKYCVLQVISRSECLNSVTSFLLLYFFFQFKELRGVVTTMMMPLYCAFSTILWPLFWSFLCNCVQNHPKLRVGDPLDYEGQLITRRKDLEHKKYLNLLFPQQDVMVGVVMWFYTSLRPSLPPFLMISFRDNVLCEIFFMFWQT